MPISEGAKLIIEQVSRLDGGSYQCQAENGVGDPKFMKISLHVLCKTNMIDVFM